MLASGRIIYLYLFVEAYKISLIVVCVIVVVLLITIGGYIIIKGPSQLR